MIQAVGNYVLVELKYADKKHSLFVPDQAKQYSGSFWGLVVSVGDECHLRHELKAGNRVRFERHEGFKVFKDEIGYLAVKARWVYGKEDI